MIYENPKDGKMVDSPYSTEEAQKRIKKLTSDFAISLAGKTNPSPGQEFWIHKLATSMATGFQKITDLFARVPLKFPKIEIADIRLTQGRGRIYVKRDGKVLGTIDGDAWEGSVAPPAILVALAEDPAAVSAIQGRKMGACCYCRRELTTDASLSVGYGPICADKWGLPWGEVSKKMKYDQLKKNISAIERADQIAATAGLGGAVVEAEDV